MCHTREQKGLESLATCVIPQSEADKKHYRRVLQARKQQSEYRLTQAKIPRTVRKAGKNRNHKGGRDKIDNVLKKLSDVSAERKGAVRPIQLRNTAAEHQEIRHHREHKQEHAETRNDVDSLQRGIHTADEQQYRYQTGRHLGKIFGVEHLRVGQQKIERRIDEIAGVDRHERDFELWQAVRHKADNVAVKMCFDINSRQKEQKTNR